MADDQQPADMGPQPCLDRFDRIYVQMVVGFLED